MPWLDTLVFRARGDFTTSFYQIEMLLPMIRTRFGVYRDGYTRSASMNCAPRPQLQEVIFLWSSESHICSDIAPKLSGYSYDHLPQEDQAWRDVDSRTRDEFLASDHPRRAFFSTVLMHRFDRLLKELESLDLGTMWEGRKLTKEELWQEIVGLARPGERSYSRLKDWRY